MSTISPDGESARLAALYSEMSEEELQLLAAEPDSLTDLARHTLHIELQRRGLPATPSGPVSDAAETHEPGLEDSGKAVTIARFRGLLEASIAKSLLDSAAISCFLLDDNMVRMDWFFSDGLGGVRLQVAEEDVEDALEVLRQHPAQTADPE
jgi:putative signal transducing protein